jgi:hypothetical protein
MFYVLPGDADPPQAGSMTAFIRIRGCRHMDRGKLLFIFNRVRVQGSAEKIFFN